MDYGHGDNCEVIQPESLRLELVDYIKAVLKSYEGEK